MRVIRAEKVPFRPYLMCEIGVNVARNQLLQLVNICWHPDPAARPDFNRICIEFRAINKDK